MGHLRFHFSPKIRWKILGPYLLLALALATLATYVVTRVVAGSLEERFTNQLVESARVAGDAIVRREREHLEVVRAITFTEGIEAAIVLSDTAAAQRIVLPIAANSAARGRLRHRSDRQSHLRCTPHRRRDTRLRTDRG